jgi:Rieske Fe-S protein
MQCNVHWDSSLQQFLCPCHGGLYALDGSNVGGPPPSPLAQWDHTVQPQPDGSLLLTVYNAYSESI